MSDITSKTGREEVVYRPAELACDVRYAIFLHFPRYRNALTTTNLYMDKDGFIVVQETIANSPGVKLCKSNAEIYKLAFSFYCFGKENLNCK